MNFLTRVNAAKGDTYIHLDDVYDLDPQYKQLLSFTTDLLYKFAEKFNLSDEKMLDIFIKSLKKEF